MIVDRQGRRFRNLRISLTSACNYACTYCVPNGKRLVAAQDELSAEAMARGVAYLIEAAGIERLRITGGEPLVSPKLEASLGHVTRVKRYIIIRCNVPVIRQGEVKTIVR